MSAAFASTIPNSRTIKALVKRLLRPLVLRIRWMAARLDIGGAADAERARRGVLSLTAALATLEVTLAEQAETIEELRAELTELREQLDSTDADEADLSTLSGVD